MNTTRLLTPGWLILLLALILIAVAVILFQHVNLSPLLAPTAVEYAKVAATMVEYAKNAGHVLAATAIEY